MLLAFVILYLLSNLLIGWWASRKVKTAQDFALAGRRLPIFLASTAIFATWFGSETVLGASAEFVKHGFIGVIEDPFGAALCLILIAAFFTKPLYRLNLLSFNDYYRLRYNPQVELVSAICMVPSYFGWVAGQLVAMAIILKAIIGLPLVYGILLCASIVVIYTYIGGMWAVSVTDFVQTIFILVGLLCLLVVMVYQVGGVSRLYAQTPSGFFSITPKANLQDFLQYLVAWITVGLGSIPQQDVFQRVMASKTEKGAIVSTYVAALMYLTIAMFPLFIALCGRILYPEMLKGDTQMLLPQLVLQHFGLGMQILFFGALLSAILSTTSGAVLAPSVVFTENVVKYFYPNMTDKEELRMMRYSVIGIAFCSSLMAASNESIYELVRQSSTLILVSLFIPLWAGIYWRKASSAGAMLSIILGMFTWFFSEWMMFSFPSILSGLGISFLGMCVGTWLYPNQNKPLH